jgi:RNA polymerase sigma-70 factor (ECF subfamily)
LEHLYAGDDEVAARAALVELRRRHDKNLRAQAYRQCGSNADLHEEAMQRLDMRLWEKRKEYNPEKGRWIPWTKTLLRNIIIDLFRAPGRGGSAPGPGPTGPDASPGDPMDQFPGREPAPDVGVKLQELQQAMTECLQRLQPEQRGALILRELEGLSYEEIGERTEVPWQTAATRVRLAKEKMRECLKRKGYEGGEV